MYAPIINKIFVFILFLESYQFAIKQAQKLCDDDKYLKYCTHHRNTVFKLIEETVIIHSTRV